MTDLISTLTSQLGIDSSQAEGGLGAIAKLAQEKLGEGDFSQLAGKLPGLADMVGKAPSTDGATGGGLGGMMGAALGAIGGDSMGNLGTLVSSFDKLGLDAGMVTKFAPIVMNYIEENGGDLAKTLMAKIL